MCYFYKSFQTSATECSNKGLSTIGKESLGKCLCVMLQAIKLR